MLNEVSDSSLNDFYSDFCLLGENVSPNIEFMELELDENKLISHAGQRRLRTETLPYQKNIQHLLSSNGAFSTSLDALSTRDVNYLKNGTPAASEGFLLEMRPSDLEALVGLPFASKVNESFKIHEKNSNGEVVGTAAFKMDQNGATTEEVVWHWSQEKGFDIISSKSEMFRLCGVSNIRTTFFFDQIKINNLGIVATSFSIGDRNPTSWCWWSKDQGLHTAELINDSFLLRDIDSLGNVLLSNGNKFFTTNIYSMNERKEFDYPISEINRAVKDWLLEYCKTHNIENIAELLGLNNSPANENLGIRWLSSSPHIPMNLRTDCFLKDGRIQGSAGGWCRLFYSKNPIEKHWPKSPVRLEVYFTMCDRKISVEVKAK